MTSDARNVCVATFVKPNLSKKELLKRY